MNAPPGDEVAVLLVDDDAELCELMQEFFVRNGLRLEAVHDGRRGLARALAGEHDLVLLDAMLPGLDGFELLRLVRRRSEVPVIMLTARTAQADREVALARVRKEADRMAVLVGELLELTRVEGDPDDAHPEPVALDDLLREIARDSALEAEARCCRLRLRIDGPVALPGGRELLQRAIENVVRNAIRHAPDGTAIDVGLGRDGDSATVLVRDRGPGVPAAMLAEIFRPFFHADDDRNRASGGVGLGLAIARRAVAVHGGTISARNADPGLAVAITLPAAIPSGRRGPSAPGPNPFAGARRMR